MKNIVFIGSVGEQNNGPTMILRKLIEQFSNEPDIRTETILLDANTSKQAFIQRIIKDVLKGKGKIINVHTNGFLVPYFIYLISRINKKNEYYLTVHGLYIVEAEISKSKKRIYSWLERRLCQKFPNLICVSDMLTKNIEQFYHRTKQVYVIGNATDATEVIAETDVENNLQLHTPIRFISLGGINRRKGVFNNLSWMNALINEYHVDARLDIYGSIESDEVSEKYEETKQKFHLDKVINYCGYLNGKTEVYQKLMEADFQLCMSIYDTFNVAIIEGMVCGCPCLSTYACGAIDFIKPNENGFLWDKETENQLCQKLANMSDKEYSIMSDKAREIAPFVTWSYIAKQYQKLFWKENGI